MKRRKLNGPLRLLAYLLDKDEEITVFKIRKETNLNIQTIYNAIDLLKQLGFISERYVTGPPVKRLIKLTEKGKEAAYHAKRLLELAGEL